MNKVDKIKVYSILSVCILIFTIFIVKGYYFVSLLPFVLVIIFIAFYRIDLYFLIIVALVPISIPLFELKKGLDYDMWLPSEPLLVGLLFLFIFKMLSKEKLERKFLFHPVSITIYIYLLWMFITVLSSTMFVVSLKFLITRIWFLVAFYFVASEIFKDEKNVRRYLWCFIIPLLFVLGYSINRHLDIGLIDYKTSHSVMSPFFRDHTSYGAVIAFLIPVAGGLTLIKSYKPIIRIIALGIFVFLCIALVLSYARAAWLSLFVAVGFIMVLLLRIKFSVLLIIAVVVGSFLYMNFEQYYQQLEKNSQESSADFADHLTSVSNVSSDMSNLERINRWNSAIRMYKEKPVFGWGPGTYMFQYAPFQVASEKTDISTNVGDRGNAHSEYLGPLAESGLPGMLTFILIIVTVIFTGIRVYSRAKNRNIRIISASVLAGLITYYVHGVMNNFLDTDKASALFWGFTAILVVFDIYFTEDKKTKSEKLNTHN